MTTNKAAERLSVTAQTKVITQALRSKDPEEFGAAMVDMIRELDRPIWQERIAEAKAEGRREALEQIRLRLNSIPMGGGVWWQIVNVLDEEATR